MCCFGEVLIASDGLNHEVGILKDLLYMLFLNILANETSIRNIVFVSIVKNKISFICYVEDLF
jgi:hypothetical protein